MDDLYGIIKQKDIELFIKKIEAYKNMLSILQRGIESAPEKEAEGKAILRENKINFLIKTIDTTIGNIIPDAEVFKNTLKKSLKKAQSGL